MEYVEAILLSAILGMQVYTRFGPDKAPPPETLPATRASMTQLIQAVDNGTAATTRVSGQIDDLSKQNENLYHALR